MKRIALSVALLALASFTVTASADEASKERGKMRRDDAQRQKDGPRGGAAQRDPAVMVAQMMKQFDKDGDEKLDVSELTAMMKSMRDRRGGKGRPDAGARTRRGGKQGGDSAKGGQKPKRPE
ncbi:EF-hand domain-containing protein [Planctomycetes bacterium K23_9]|uniref:EF hand n=1 Tax=Stieleria marina TaxID=1930275 RepID=A0A517NN12_9BACT|nr:EF hand [Planctomycetes bacterium K23_9]